ncbi:MAG TPA: helix-turn-helix transcriptional regulator [Candidatus Cybelea sp.]|nr:helix-turn-helix transcriptional regulator [Candidatus Cybelea sp.]
MPQSNLERSRSELSDFLKSRRARLSPDDVGLPVGARRRTKGLRREEVASLAGVGLTWYTWFEQGRDIRVSPDFLENVARALRLNGAERQHLYLLLDGEVAKAALTERRVSRALQRMIDGIPHYAAYIRTPRWDVIAWNKTAARLFGFGRKTQEERNLMRMIFIDPEFRAMIPNLDTSGPMTVARFRGEYAKYRGDPVMDALVKELQQRSSEFRLWWRRHDVMTSSEGIKTLRIRGKDVLFEHASFSVNGEPDLTLVVYAPLDAAAPQSVDGKRRA